MYAIEIRNISKTYRLYRRPIDRLKEAILRRRFHQPFESLKDISFVVPFGETIGIIGENGAGKSTLLKILAGTLTPTTGEIRIQGRVAALLELGAGFHPEFTGRQNIFLNAALQGLRESEILDCERPIIDFAELGPFIDRPLKTYSSGMVMRLAFSIATSIAPDILIIDEALSVGDQRFQQKCIERMVGFRNRKKTIIVCSHSMYLINELCAETLWLANGRICSRGPSANVISEYMAYLEQGAVGNPADGALRSEPDTDPPEVMIDGLCIRDGDEKPLDQVKQFQTLVVQVRTRRRGPPLKGHLGVGLERPDGQLVFGATTKNSGMKPFEFVDEQVFELVIPSIPFFGGSYRVRALVGDQHTLRAIDESRSDPFLIVSEHPEFGMFWMEHHWRIPKSSEKSFTVQPKAEGEKNAR